MMPQYKVYRTMNSFTNEGITERDVYKIRSTFVFILCKVKGLL